MENAERKQKRNRPRKKKSENKLTPKKRPNLRWVILIPLGMAFLGAIGGQTVDPNTAITLGIVGFVIGSIGAVAILVGRNLPARKGAEHASNNYLVGYEMPDVDDILK